MDGCGAAAILHGDGKRQPARMVGGVAALGGRWRHSRHCRRARGRGPVTTILAVAEQGMGDAIQMARFLPLLLDRCDTLAVQCHASLVKLFQRQARERWTVLPMEAEPPEHDLWLGFMSLPAYLGTTLETLPPPADFDVAIVDWRGPLYGSPPMPWRIALCTQGGKVASLDLDRSDHTGSLATLRDVPGVEWVDFTGRVGDWLDTAHELATCDLLISVDSALAHLAGSLSVETWLVPPTHFEWRWLDGREDSPWYPTHRLYRREHTNDWPGVTQHIRRDLERRING